MGIQNKKIKHSTVSNCTSQISDILKSTCSHVIGIHVALPPDRYWGTFGPIVAVIIYYTFPICIADALTQCLLESVQGLLADDDIEFVNNTYIPRFQQALKENEIDPPRLGTRLSLISQLLGVALKLVSFSIISGSGIPMCVASSFSKKSNATFPRVLGPCSLLGGRISSVS